MLRLILNGSVATKSMESLTTTLMRCMSVEQNPRTFDERKPLRERMRVILCGRIREAPVKLEKGTMVVPITTINDHDGFQTKHRIHVASQNLQNLLADRLTEGERVYASGFIGYSQFQSIEGYNKQSGMIVANEIFLCEQNEISSDINEVNFFGRVQFPAKNTATATFLEVATYYFDGKEQIIKKRLHQVLIKDDENLRQQASSMEVGTGVFVHGSLRTEFRRNQDEQLRATYYIIPTKLVVSQHKAKANHIDVDESSA